MNPAAVSETMQGETVTWLQTLAKARNCAITGRLLLKTIRFITDWFFISIREKFSIMTKTFVYAFWRRQGIHAGNQSYYRIYGLENLPTDLL
jgi:hypothetical protein